MLFINIKIILKRGIAIFILFLPLLASSQHNALLSELMSTSKAGNANTASQKLLEFEVGLKRKPHSSDHAFLQVVFAKTQRKFLKHFSPYTDLNEIFSTGEYDCLTGTSLFSVILSDLHFQHRIVETNYHIFLIVQTTKGDVLIETTDRYNGFVSDRKEIEKRLGSYRQNAISPVVTSSNKPYHAYHFSLYQDVKPAQLAGLLYYNQAVRAFNKRDLVAAADLLDKAKVIYESPRVAELAVILIETVLDSDLSENSKLLILERYKIYWAQRSRLMAAN
jgi:hypothetical protein